MYHWEPHIPQGAIWVVEASCCEAYILCNDGSEHFVRRRTADGGYEETARGPYLRASHAWVELATGHQHQRRAAS